MTEQVKKKYEDPRYPPPYPQEFHPWWPKHFRAGIVIFSVVVLVGVLLSYFFQFPSDVNMPPMPDDGANIPSPEWFLLLMFQAFWFIPNEYAFLQQLFNFWLPLVAFVLLLLAPFIIGNKDKEGVRMTRRWTLIMGLSVGFFFLIAASGLIGSGASAKIYGCASCHNPMMGVRQALPPSNMAEYYRVQRKRQVEVGKYRAGKSEGSGTSLMQGGMQTYKDANWQLRHMYEPTMTW